MLFGVFKKNKKNKKNKYIHDGIFINNADGTYTVYYSKYSFLKKGDILTDGCFRDALHCYKFAFVTNDLKEEDER